jgi:hypothetical protein
MIHLALSIASFIFLAWVAFMAIVLVVRFPGFFLSLLAVVVIGFMILLNSGDNAKVVAVAYEEPLPPAYKVPNTYNYESNPNRDPITGEWILPENR